MSLGKLGYGRNYYGGSGEAPEAQRKAENDEGLLNGQNEEPPVARQGWMQAVAVDDDAALAFVAALGRAVH